MATIVSDHNTNSLRERRNIGVFRFLKLRYIVFFGIMGWAVYHYWNVQHPQLQSLVTKQQQLKTQLAELQKQHDTLTKQVKDFNNYAYIAKFANEKYGYVLPGQVSFDINH